MVTPMMFQSMITPKSLYPSINQQFQIPSLNQQFESSDINPCGLKSHITSDGNFCWYTKDNEIFFYELNTGKRITTWCFVKDSKELLVTSVGELFIEDSMFLVATIKYDNNKTFLKVLDTHSGDVIRTVDIGTSNVNYIKQIYRESLHSSPKDSMRNIKTPLALGFENSCQVIIIDLYFNPKDKSIESSSKIQQLILQDLSNYNFKQFYQNNNINNKLVPYFVLGCDQFEPNNTFEYPISKKGESEGILVNGLGTTQQTLKNNQDQPTQQQSNCQISSIFYIDSISAIAVGYSIGTFQLFSSINFKLHYCSPLRESTSFAPSQNHQSPVTHILYQELEEDDHSPIGNLWIGRGSMNQDSTTHQISIILYKLIFDQMTPDPSKSLINLISIDQNLDLPLNLIYSNQQSQQQQQHSYPGEILSLDYLYQNSDINTEKGLILKSKSIITYQYIGNDGLPKIEMKLFDLELLERFGISQTNKQAWIHNIELIKSDLNTSFHSFWLDQDSVSYNTLYHIDNNLNGSTNNKLNFDNSNKFSINHPNFKVKLLTFNSIDLIDYLNPQERLVKELSDKGAIIFEHPNATYQRFIDTQIFPSSSSPSGTALSDKQKQKNDLMIFSLNNNLLSIITDYILNYKSSNAKLILDLFWSYFERIQSQFNINELFSKVISTETQKQFENVYVKVVDLVRIFRSLIERYLIEQNKNNSSAMDTSIDSTSSTSSTSSSSNVPDNLKNKLDQAINMALFIQVLKWCMNFDLFGPLHLKGMENVRVLTVQKRKLLSDKLINQLNLGASNKVNIQDKLLIDLFYDKINNIDHSINYYPPNSSSSLKNFIQIFSTSNQFKKKIALLFYLLIDLETVSSETKNIHSSDTLKSFLGSFNITNKYYSFIMGIWKLDNYLLQLNSNPNGYNNDEEIKSSFTLLNSSSITKKFIYPILSRFYSFGFNNYSQLLMKGWGFEPKNFDEASLYIKILLSNDAILESILFQRSFRSRFPDLPLKSVESLLFSIFKLALDLKKLDLIIDMPLDETEEQVFIQYLFINKASSLISIFYIKRGRIPEACKINRNHSIATSRNIGDVFDGYDTINHLLLNYEQSLPTIQKPSNFYTTNQQQQQQQSIDNEDIPLLPRSITNNSKSQVIINNGNNNNNFLNLPPQSFIQKPLISTLQTPKLYNESIYFSSNLSTAPVSNLEALTKKSEEDKKEKMEIQQKLHQMEEQKKREAQEEIRKKEQAIQDELRKQREAEELRKQELEKQRKLEVERVKQLQQQQLEQQQLEQQQLEQQQQQQIPQSPMSSNLNASPISSPSILKSALKTTPSSSGSSKKSSRVRFKDSLNSIYEIPALKKKTSTYDDDDDDDDDDYEEEEEEEDYDSDEEQQEDDEDIYEEEDIYDVDDMIIHEDNDNDQNSQYTQFMKQQQQKQQTEDDEQDLSEEEYNDNEDEEFDENEEDPFKDIKRPEHGGKEPPKYYQYSMLSKPKSQYKQEEQEEQEQEEQEQQEEQEEQEDSVEYDEDDVQKKQQQVQDNGEYDDEDDSEYDDDGYEEENKAFRSNISDGFGTEDKPMEILSSDEEVEPPPKNKKAVAHRPAELNQEDDDSEEDNDQFYEDQDDKQTNDYENNSEDDESDSEPPSTQKQSKTLDSSIEFDQDNDY